MDEAGAVPLFYCHGDVAFTIPQAQHGECNDRQWSCPACQRRQAEGMTHAAWSMLEPACPDFVRYASKDLPGRYHRAYRIEEHGLGVGVHPEGVWGSVDRDELAATTLE